MKNDRLFQMLYILLERETITAPELAETLEVSVRTVYRDVEALSMAGVPIFASAGKGGGISLMKNYAFDKALLSDDEQNQILFTLQSFAAAGLNMDTLLSKLGGIFQKPNAHWVSVDFSRWGFNAVDNARFEALKTAVLQKQVLRIQYCGSSGKTDEREIKPFRLVYKDKNWYVQAFCLKAEDYRLFKVNRMMEMVPTGEHFLETYPDAPSVNLDTPMMIYTFSAILLFSPDAAFRVYDEFHHAQIEKQSDGSLRVTAELPVDDWVSQYLFSYGTLVRVLSPKNLKEKMAAFAKSVYEHHIT